MNYIIRKQELAKRLYSYMEPPYDRAVHQVTIQNGTPLYDILGKEQMGVNSLHHQAIKERSQHFQPMAISEDGLIESIYMPTRKYVAGVQWHPEHLNDDNSRKIVHSFVDSICR